MSADDPEEAVEQDVDEPGGMSERTAKVVLVVVACGAMWGIVAALPEVAYVVVGVLGCLTWQRAHGWIGRRQGSGEEEVEPEDEPDVAEALRSLSGGGSHVLLTRLQKEIGAPDTKTVRRLLKAAGIRVRSGVRTPAGNGPGVHQADIPASPPGEEAPVGGSCLCRSGNNANANNASAGMPEEELRVVRIGTDGKIIYDPKDTIRHHRVK